MPAWSSETLEVGAPRPAPRRSLLLHALAFVLGFSVVFVVGWGGAATLLGQLFAAQKAWLGRLGGVVVILFGLHTLGWVRIPWLVYDTRPDMAAATGNRAWPGWLRAALMGVFFAAGWTPCVGTTLGAILTLGMSQETAGTAMALSAVYALGLGIPFLLLGWSVERATAWVARFRRHVRKVEILSGLLLLFIGLLLVTNRLAWIAIWAQRNGLYLDPGGAFGAPTVTLALVSGLLSFLSPCVLPLVPAYLGYLSSEAFQQPHA